MFFEYEKKSKRPLEEFSWLKDGKFHVNPSDWAEIKERFPRKEIMVHLMGLIKEHQISPPLYEDSKSKILSEYRKMLNKTYSIEKASWNTHRVKNLDFLYLKEPVLLPLERPTAKRVSNYYMQEVRLASKFNTRKWSYLDEWNEILKGGLTFSPTLNATIHFENKYLRDYSFVVGGRLGGSFVSQFKPSVAKTVYDFFDAKSVLDFSSGWGDRLLGFLASNAESYIGIDPNTKLYERYKQIENDFNNGKETKFICSPAEDVDYSKLRYDFAFTSPPYFDMELYNEEETQSVKRYPKLDLWLKGFLFKSLSKIYEGLDVGGRIAVNISDNAYRKIFVCKPMIEHMKSIGATYEGTVGYGLARRPSEFEDKLSKEKSEPIFIWSKGEAKDPKWNQDNFFGV